MDARTNVNGKEADDMEWIKRWLLQARVQLANLNTSEQMLIGTLLVVIPMLFFGVARYAAAPEMVPLLNQSFGGDEQARITQHLRAMGIDFELAGNFINVKSEQRNEIFASLGLEQLLPEDTSSGFKEMIEKQTWWQSSAQTKQMYQIALQNRLENIIQSYDWVHDARVMISLPESGGVFGARAVSPSASVSIDMQSGALSQRQVDAIAGVVAGAKAELLPKHVTIIDEKAGKPWHASDSEVYGGDNVYLENQQLVEKRYTDKINEMLRYLTDKIVVVNADIDQTWRKTDEVAYTKDNSLELQSTTRSYNTVSSSGSNGGEPGVNPNVGVSIAGSGAGTENTSDEAEATYDTHAGYKHEISANPGGHATRVSATVSIPRSFFVKQFMYGKPADTPEPTDAALQALIDPYLAQVEKQVAPLLIAQGAPGEVVVAMYPDMTQSPFDTEQQATLVGGRKSVV